MIKNALTTVSTVFVLIIFVGFFTIFSYVAGYSSGFINASDKAKVEIASLLANVSSADYVLKEVGQQEEKIVKNAPILEPIRMPTWGGPDLWKATNKARVEFGVNPLIQRDELCTIASIRLNELLDLGKLDGHEGFGNMTERRPDLQWIFDNYGNISEFLVSGAQTADQAVELWKNTLGHKKLLSGGEYVWGCIYAQNSFGVAIAAY